MVRILVIGFPDHIRDEIRELLRDVVRIKLASIGCRYSGRNKSARLGILMMMSPPSGDGDEPLNLYDQHLK